MSFLASQTSSGLLHVTAEHRALIVNIFEAKAQLSRLVDEVAEGHEIILGKLGKPMV